jgi:hypothetical protein
MREEPERRARNRRHILLHRVLAAAVRRRMQSMERNPDKERDVSGGGDFVGAGDVAGPGQWGELLAQGVGGE